MMIPGQTDPIALAWERLRDWVYDNYRIAYAVGTLVIIHTVVFPSLQWTLGLWGICLALGSLVDHCLDPADQLCGKTLVAGTRGVALTFDDGPSPPITGRLLDLLAREEVPAAFFLIGESAVRHPELVARMRSEGHLVGNHTQTHANLLLLTPAGGRVEVEAGGTSIASVLGEPPRYFRPPFGFRYPWTLRAARNLGQEPVMWSLNPRDFQDPGVDTIVARVLDQVKPGSIILLHDGPGDREQTLAAVEKLIPALRERGLPLVRLDQM